MITNELENLVKNHSGTFSCIGIHDDSLTKKVPFKHKYDPPLSESNLEELNREFGNLPELIQFYRVFGSLLLYFDEKSDDAALYIASPNQWIELDNYLADWLDGVEEEEREDFLPNWINERLVIGEIPQSGNYLIVPTSGEKAGFIYEFEHDGFEFIEMANNVDEYIKKMLNPDSLTLTNIATHMRFIEEDPMMQWWIKELIYDNGKVVSTNN